MQFCTSFITASAVISMVSAAIFNVTVGKDNQLLYDPSFLTGVQNGDIIGFRFVSKSHSVTQSTFDKPCAKKANGIDSGIISSANFPQWSTTIGDVSAPLWFYCIPHCNQGMVFAINPTADNTFNAFSAAAKGMTLPSGVTTSSAAPSTLPPATATSSFSTTTTGNTPGTTTLPAATSSISTTSTSDALLSQGLAHKVALWLPILGLVLSLAL